MHQTVEVAALVGVESAKIRLGNLYLQHVLAFVRNDRVATAYEDTVEPSEHVMRFVEHEGGISETECNLFRDEVARQFTKNRMDLLYSKLECALELICICEPDKVEAWFSTYLISLPLMKVNT